jgi:hypothetical protein
MSALATRTLTARSVKQYRQSYISVAVFLKIQITHLKHVSTESLI